MRKELYSWVCIFFFLSLASTMGKLFGSAEIVNWMSRSLRAKILGMDKKTFRVSNWIQSGWNQAFDNKVGTFYDNIDMVRFLHVYFPGNKLLQYHNYLPFVQYFIQEKNCIFQDFSLIYLLCCKLFVKIKYKMLECGNVKVLPTFENYSCEKKLQCQREEEGEGIIQVPWDR